MKTGSTVLIAFILALGLYLVSDSSVAKADTMAYMETSLGQLGTVDLTTGATSIIGFIGSGNGFNCGLGVANGTLYATTNNCILGQLWSVDPGPKMEGSVSSQYVRCRGIGDNRT